MASSIQTTQRFTHVCLYLYPFYHTDILEIDMSGYERYPLYRFHIVSFLRTGPLVLYVPRFVPFICTTGHANFFTIPAAHHPHDCTQRNIWINSICALILDIVVPNTPYMSAQSA